MDHFAGFDQLLRVFLGREKAVGIYGPPVSSTRSNTSSGHTPGTSSRATKAI